MQLACWRSLDWLTKGAHSSMKAWSEQLDPAGETGVSVSCHGCQLKSLMDRR